MLLNIPLKFTTRKMCLGVKRIEPLKRAGKNLLIYLSLFFFFFLGGLKILLRSHYTKHERGCAYQRSPLFLQFKNLGFRSLRLVLLNGDMYFEKKHDILSEKW